MDNIREVLETLADDKYKDFHAKLVPGSNAIIGVRIPKLRALAKEIAKQNWQEYLEKAQDSTNEELMLQGMVIGYVKVDLSERFKLLDTFVPKINNWAVCDSCCATYKFMKKNQNYSWDYISKYINSDSEYQIRFALVCMLDHFINDEYVEKVIESVNSIKNKKYYVNMAQAWCISVCYVKYPEITESFLKNNNLDDFTHNKSIQKICESLRVTEEQKRRIKGMYLRQV